MQAPRQRRNGISKAACAKDALKDADLCIIQSDWPEFASLEPQDFITLMKKPVVVDGRRTYDPEKMIKSGITYVGMGWKNLKARPKS